MVRVSRFGVGASLFRVQDLRVLGAEGVDSRFGCSFSPTLASSWPSHLAAYPRLAMQHLCCITDRGTGTLGCTTPAYRKKESSWLGSAVIHSSKLTWKWREAPYSTNILYIGPFMSFHVHLGERNSRRLRTWACESYRMGSLLGLKCERQPSLAPQGPTI